MRRLGALLGGGLVAAFCGWLVWIAQDHWNYANLGIGLVAGGLSGFSVGLPVRLSERTGMSKGDKVSVVCALASLALSATTLMGAVAIASDDATPFYVFLGSVLVGTAAAIFVKPRIVVQSPTKVIPESR